MRANLRVAAAQIECVAGAIAANLHTHLAAIDEARRLGADVLVFPELSLTDYETAPDVRVLGRGRDSTEIGRLAEAAGPMAVVVGFIEAAEDGAFYNAQATLREGCVLHVHRKVNLPSYGRLEETRHYAPGRHVDTFSLGGTWTASTLICADTWNPALPWLVALKGASLLIVPVASALDAVGGDFDNPGSWDVNLRHCALTYALPTVMTNHCGARGQLRFWGGSRILDPFGGELARAGATPELIWADLPEEEVRRARELLPTVRDATPGLVQAELSRILDEANGVPRRED